MELDLLSLFRVHVHSCRYSLAENPRPPPLRLWAHLRRRYWSAKTDDISLWPPLLENWMSSAFFCERSILSLTSFRYTVNGDAAVHSTVHFTIMPGPGEMLKILRRDESESVNLTILINFTVTNKELEDIKDFVLAFEWFLVYYGGLQRDVVYLCWPIVFSYMSPIAGGLGLRSLSQ